MRPFFVLGIILMIYHSAAVSRDITFDDLYGMPGFGDIRISPDGRQVIFAMTVNDLEEHASATHLWLMDGASGETRQLTFGEHDNWGPQWSKDADAIYFMSDRGETTQIWRLPMDGGEPEVVTSIPTGISEFEYYPSGEIVFVSGVFPDCRSDSCNKARLEQKEDRRSSAKAYDELLYRHYIRWDDGRVNRLYMLNPDDGSVRELYSGPEDAPTSLLGGFRDFDLSPDGIEFCFSMNIDSMPAVWLNNELYRIVLPAEKPVRITDNPGLDVSPQYSPDGKYLAYLSTARAGYESDQRDLILYDRTTGNRENLTASFDRSIGYYTWAGGSKRIYFTAIEHGRSKIWRLDIESGGIALILGDAVYGDLTVSPDGSYLLVTRSLAHEPQEIYRYDLDTEDLTRMTFMTIPGVDELDMRAATDFWFTGAFGDSVHGFLTLPPHFDSTRRYPLVLLIHGGPQWCWLGNFNYYGWNTQLTAAEGYVVAQIDPHGSIGYGLKFKEYVSGNWGRGDYDDLMMGVDYLIENYPYIDSTRMAALGRSYGGFMANWICGHTDRFRCLISIDGTFNHVSSYGSTEELWFPEWEFKGTPYDNPEEYVRSSPLTYASDFSTPTMVIHGEKDYRVDLSEGLQMFTALQRGGVPSQLLYFPDEGHNIGKLKNLRYVYEKQYEWLRRWLGR